MSRCLQVCPMLRGGWGHFGSPRAEMTTFLLTESLLLFPTPHHMLKCRPKDSSFPPTPSRTKDAPSTAPACLLQLLPLFHAQARQAARVWRPHPGPRSLVCAEMYALWLPHPTRAEVSWVTPSVGHVYRPTYLETTQNVLQIQTKNSSETQGLYPPHAPCFTDGN